jgi:hypothetical protein
MVVKDVALEIAASCNAGARAHEVNQLIFRYRFYCAQQRESEAAAAEAKLRQIVNSVALLGSHC